MVIALIALLAMLRQDSPWLVSSKMAAQDGVIIRKVRQSTFCQKLEPVTSGSLLRL